MRLIHQHAFNPISHKIYKFIPEIHALPVIQIYMSEIEI